MSDPHSAQTSSDLIYPGTSVATSRRTLLLSYRSSHSLHSLRLNALLCELLKSLKPQSQQRRTELGHQLQTKFVDDFGAPGYKFAS
jgi:hypothetical protein